MMRYKIQLRTPGVILNVGGLVQHVVATTGTKAEVCVYVEDADKAKFEKLIDNAHDVTKYKADSIGKRDWSAASKKEGKAHAGKS